MFSENVMVWLIRGVLERDFINRDSCDEIDCGSEDEK